MERNDKITDRTFFKKLNILRIILWSLMRKHIKIPILLQVIYKIYIISV